MEIRRGGHVNIVVVGVLLWTLATGNTEAKRMLKGRNMAVRDGGQPTKNEVAERAWMLCSKELLTILKDRGENIDFCLWDKTIKYSRSKSPTRTKMDITISHLPPKRRKVLFHCLRKQNLAVSSDNLATGGGDHLVKCFRLVCCLPNISRRYLSNDYYLLAPSTTASTEELTNFNPLVHLFFQEKLQRDSDTSDSTKHSPPAAYLHSPPSSKGSKNHPSKKKKKNDLQKQTFVAIIATATTTFCFVAMVFTCWFCCTDRKRTYGGRDDRPLLNLSDFSAGSSQNSRSLTSSSKDYSFSSSKVTSFRGNMSMKQNGNKESHIEDAPALEAKTEGVIPPLKPPPGRPMPLPAPASPPPALAQAPPPPPPPPSGPSPPPPPKIVRPPPAPPKKGAMRPSSLGHRRGPSDSSEPDDNESETGSSKTKLKPFFWDKVMANPGHSMVWHQLNDGSFQFNEEMIESLFGYNASETNKSNGRRSTSEPSSQYIQIIDPRKAQNLSILIRALNVTTEELIDALQQGNQLPIELLQTLLKMSPTSEEELKLRLFAGDVSRLGPAERFLKLLIEIPFAFKRIDSLTFMGCFEEEVSTLKESFATLEVACNKLRHSRLFLKLLEAVLKTGNRMNDGTYRGGAQAFKLDTLLKLSDVKGTDGKTTLLNFVVVEIIRSEGIRAVRNARQKPSLSSVNSGLSSVRSEDFVEDFKNNPSEEDYRNLGLQVVSGLSTELEDVKKAAVVDADVLGTALSKLRLSLTKTKTFLNTEMKDLEEEGDFYNALASFTERAEAEISELTEQEKKIMVLVKSTGDYFHGQSGRDEGLRLFVIVKDFLVMLDQACKQVRDARAKKKTMGTKKETPSSSPSSEHRQHSDLNRRRLFPAIAERRMDSSSSDDDSP